MYCSVLWVQALFTVLLLKFQDGISVPLRFVHSIFVGIFFSNQGTNSTNTSTVDHSKTAFQLLLVLFVLFSLVYCFVLL